MTDAPVRPTAAFMWTHPARWIALGLGSGLSPKAPGTVGTLWAWLVFAVLAPWMNDAGWAALIGGGTLVGWWACTTTARHLRTPDPSAVVWDEVVAFWLVLWLIAPAGWLGQAVAFALFRFFDAAKPGPVGWADRLFKAERGPQGGYEIGWAQGFGILFDDFVAAGCTLLVYAAGRAWLG
ncbi:phosphatidylglycerophosphatase A [Roseateles sp. BYS87W]|uniref:Phosphatidylglycerophosphatase A n=1 Tax=Pelomonas baiyunensis TaxID=3299026 RepID=A0ABW7H144_9BURK